MLAAVLATVALATPACAEDQPCWQWPTMGNLERGIYLRHHTRRTTVDACEFAYADYKARIDWTRTPHLRGDAYARAHGCNPHLFAPDAG